MVTHDGYLALRLRCSDLHRDFKPPQWTVNPSRASPAPRSGDSRLTWTRALSGYYVSVREVNWLLLCDPNKPRGRGQRKRGNGGFNLFTSQCSHESGHKPRGRPMWQSQRVRHCSIRRVHARPCRLRQGKPRGNPATGSVADRRPHCFPPRHVCILLSVWAQHRIFHLQLDLLSV